MPTGTGDPEIERPGTPPDRTRRASGLTQRRPRFVARLVKFAFMEEMAVERHDSVSDYVATFGERSAADSRVLMELMRRVGGHEPKLWNAGTIGFGTYHYKYDSGREGDGLVIGFYPRKGKITGYLMDGTARHADLLARMGRHTGTGYCVYIKRLSDIALPILEQIVQQSYQYIKAESKDGPIDRILSKTV